MTLYILLRTIVKSFPLIRVLFRLSYILIKGICSRCLMSIGLTLYWLADSQANRYRPVPIFYGLHSSIRKRRLRFLRTKGQLLGRCYLASRLCLRTFRSFFNPVRRLLTKALWSLVIILGLSLLPLLALLSVVFLSTFFI